MKKLIISLWLISLLGVVFGDEILSGNHLPQKYWDLKKSIVIEGDVYEPIIIKRNAIIYQKMIDIFDKHYTIEKAIYLNKNKDLEYKFRKEQSFLNSGHILFDTSKEKGWNLQEDKYKQKLRQIDRRYIYPIYINIGYSSKVAWEIAKVRCFRERRGRPIDNAEGLAVYQKELQQQSKLLKKLTDKKIYPLSLIKSYFYNLWRLKHKKKQVVKTDEAVAWYEKHKDKIPDSEWMRSKKDTDSFIKKVILYYDKLHKQGKTDVTKEQITKELNNKIKSLKDKGLKFRYP